MVQRFKENQDANERTSNNSGGVESLVRPRGVPNQNKSNLGVSGRPLGPPRSMPAPPASKSAGAGSADSGVRGAANSRPPVPPRASGGRGGELPINIRARVRAGAGAGTVPPEKVATSNAENVDGVPGRTKKDDVRPPLAAATPQPPPPPLKEGEKPAPEPEKTEGQQQLEEREESALTTTGAPVDPETGQPQKPDFDGEFTDEEGHALRPDGMPVTDPETGAPLNPEQALTQDIQKERGDTSKFMAEKEARAEKERLRRSQPSEIEGINTGHFEDVTKIERFQEMRLPGNAKMTPQMAQKYQQDVKEQLKSFGSFPGQDDPAAPAPPIREGGRSFNPYTGKFTGERGPNAFTMRGFDMEAAKREFYKNGGRADLPEPE